MPASTPQQHAAYRDGRCVDCRTAPYSAGRPRCSTCHALHICGAPPIVPPGDPDPDQEVSA